MIEQTPLQVLILEDRPEDAELMAHELRRAGFDPQWQRAETEPDFLAHLDPPPDVILADYSMPELDACRALCLLQERGLNIPFIVVSGTIGEEAAVDMMRRGGADYLLKDRLGRLGPAVKGALTESALRREKSYAEDELQASEARFHTFMHHSPALAFIKDESGRILYVNNASEGAEDIAAQLQADSSVFESGEPSRIIEQVTTPAGQTRQMLCFRFLFQDAAGRWRWAACQSILRSRKPPKKLYPRRWRPRTCFFGKSIIASRTTCKPSPACSICKPSCCPIWPPGRHCATPSAACIPWLSFTSRCTETKTWTRWISASMPAV